MRYKFSTILRDAGLRRFNFFSIYKLISFRKLKYTLVYVTGFFIFSILIYINVPVFFDYDKSKIENIICKGFNIKCSLQGEIKYSFLPTPRIKIKDFIIKDFTDPGKTVGKIRNVAIKLPIYHLYDKEKFDFTKIELENAEIDINLKNISKYKNFSVKKINLKNHKFKKRYNKIF